MARSSGKNAVTSSVKPFRHHVENDLMKREPHPDAKPMGAFPIGHPVKLNQSPV
jgi:hypothetical protein